MTGLVRDGFGRNPSNIGAFPTKQQIASVGCNPNTLYVRGMGPTCP